MNEVQFKPRLIFNDTEKKQKVLSSVLKNLNEAESFDISVAFISESGLSVLRQTLLNLHSKGIKGRIVTSTYLGFNSPKVFRQLLEFKGIETRIYLKDGFHPKGYIFHKQHFSNIMVGSSNLTQNALCRNQEWNVEFNSFYSDQISDEITSEFENQWMESIPLSEDFINEYEKQYVTNVVNNAHVNLTSEGIKPNRMQTEALENLKSIHNQGLKRALLISATGTGKTFLSAFDVKSYNPNKMLFIVHRENIARKAMQTFKTLMPNKNVGIYTGNEKQICNYTFATVQTLSKDDHLFSFDPNEFDYIIIDEVHHIGASTYQKIINYFTPNFLLGMTATPERSDGYDIYSLFDHNIAYEIRLQEAMEFDLLCPFHYYGIKDININGKSISDDADIKILTKKERMQHILNASLTYKYSGNKIHGIVFVSRVEEAKEMSNYFNSMGFYSVYLSGDDSEEKRSKIIDSFESDNGYDYIFVVDIFNEGVDIPCINQIIMARPTQSAIIFIQQLGRGLRKNPGKDYVVVIDIIGNYKNNFLIPIALSGDNSYNKDNLRKFVYEGNSLIFGCSTIDFDEISKKKIYESIDKSRVDTKLLKKAYFELKMKLGRIPTLTDFDKYGSIDPLKIIDIKRSYHNFLLSYEDDYNINFSILQNKYLEYISIKLSNGKRIHELEAIKIAIVYSTKIFEHLKNKLQNVYKTDYDVSCTKTIINILTQNFNTGSNKNAFDGAIFIQKDGDDYKISDIFANELKNASFREQIIQAIDLGIKRYIDNFANNYNDTDLVLYQKYTYEDVCRLLNWDKQVVAQNIGGYKYDEQTNTFPVFINYNKVDVKDSINYEDHFEDNKTMIAISKSGRNLKSPDVQKIINAQKNQTAIHLFVRKNRDDDSSKEFYYLGTMNQSVQEKPIEFKMKNTDKTAVEFKYILHTEVREDIFDYITS